MCVQQILIWSPLWTNSIPGRRDEEEPVLRGTSSPGNRQASDQTIASGVMRSLLGECCGLAKEDALSLGVGEELVALAVS